MTNPPELAPSEAPPTAPVQDVDAVLSTMTKALRAFNMYQANNPVFQRFRESLREVFETLWSKTDALELAVAEDGFRYGGQTFAVGKGRESLAFVFYKDGVRHLKFLPGFENEVAPFLEAVNRAMRSEDDADDLISVLWEQDFASLQYGYVDLLMEGVSVPDEPRLELDISLDLATVTAEAAADEEEAEDGEEAAGQAASPLGKGLSREDFDETLYFLDQAEMAALQTEVEIEMERDLRGDVLNALFDRLEEPGRAKRQAEILDILDQLLPLFLSRGDMTSATQILEELDKMTGAESPVGDALVERIEKLFGRLSDPEVLEQFVQALEDGAVAPESREVSLFFSRLHPEALPVLIRFAETTEVAGVRERLGSAIDGLASRYPTAVNELFTADEPALVKGAARVAGRVGLGQVVAGLQTALQHADKDVRMAVVDALVAIRLTPALQALILALDDTDRDVRIAAARALGAVRFASAREVLAAAIDAKRLKDADLTEKMAFFEAFGAVGGNSAVDQLAGILNDKGFLGRRPSTEMRACAALGLAQAGAPAAKAALERARDDEDPVVKNAVLRALKQELATR